MRRSANTSAFGAAVSSELAQRRMSQTELAEKTGKPLAYVNQTMTGRKSVSPQWADLVARALRLSAESRVALHRAAAKDRGYDIDLGAYPKKR